MRLFSAQLAVDMRARSVPFPRTTARAAARQASRSAGGSGSMHTCETAKCFCCGQHLRTGPVCGRTRVRGAMTAAAAALEACTDDIYREVACDSAGSACKTREVFTMHTPGNHTLLQRRPVSAAFLQRRSV